MDYANFYNRKFELNFTVARDAVNFLNLDVSAEAKHKLIKHLQKQFKNCGCAVLSNVQSKEILEQLGIDFEKRELIISEKNIIMYSDNYTKSPVPISI